MDATEREARLHHFAEEVGLLFEEMGMPRMMGRILGWLLVCEPPHQSSAQIAEALMASKGSISTNTRSLLQRGIIERVPMRGQRGAWFRVCNDAWVSALQKDMLALTLFRELAGRGLEVLAEEPPDRRARLQKMYDLYAFFEAEFPALLERWIAQQQEKP